MKTPALLLALCLFWLSASCGGEPAPSEAPAPEGVEPEPEPAPGDLCGAVDLVEQCPPNSIPSIEETATEGCVAEGDAITDVDGAVTGVCFTRQSCTFVCNFMDPCRCGIARIDDAGVFCAECVTACGNAKCEGGEDPQSCPIDCAERCQEGDQRCNGEGREVCERTGLWTAFSCREDQRCEVGEVGPQRRFVSICQTRAASPGGAFDGLGALGVGQDVDHSRVRFSQRDFANHAPRLTTQDGRLLVRNIRGASYELWDLDDPRLPEIERMPGGGDLEAAISQTRSASGRQVAELSTQARQLMKDPSGIFEGARALWFEEGAAALSPDGGVYALAASVGLDPEHAAPTIFVWDSPSGEPLALLRFDDEALIDPTAAPRQVAISQNNATLVAIYQGNPSSKLLVVFWDLGSGRTIRLLSLDQGAGSLTRLALDASGRDQVAIAVNARVRVFDLSDLANANPTSILSRDLPETPRHLAFSPNGALLVAGGELIDIGADRVVQSLDNNGDGAAFWARGPALMIGPVLYGEQP